MSLNSARAIVLAAIFGSAGVLASVGAAIHALGVGLRDPVGWLQTAPPEDALAMAGSVGAGLLSLYLITTTLGYAAARLTESDPWRRFLGRLMLRPVRRAVDLIAAVAVSMATLGPFGELAWAVASRPPQMVVQSRPESAVVPPGQGGVGFTVRTGDDSGPAPAPQAPPALLAEVRYEIVGGDNLWQIACRRIRSADDTAGVAMVTEYWLQLIERNGPTLRSGDPDLIYPGEIIVLPAVTGDIAP